ncbi:hypothetical protein MLC35_04185 [Sulfurimonas sp. NW7]|uniref:hypothetical protein n=1 Tax=Sulfurimonas sp. NW7 TaxID=2922727 RepID=UPI003DA80756
MVQKEVGDIDLYIIPKNQDELRKKKIDFLVKSDEYIGEQKIDVVKLMGEEMKSKPFINRLNRLEE